MKFSNILQRANVKFYEDTGHHHARYGWIQLECPFCGPRSGKYHMGYSKAGGYFTCWRCGGHSFVNTCIQLLGISYQEAKELKTRVDVVKDSRVQERGKLVLPKNLGELQPAHKRYLKKRNFKVNRIAKLWGVQGIGLSPRLAWRVFIPIHYRGEIVSWTTRSISDKGLRYVSASAQEEALPHKELLYGEDFASTVAVCVEGPLDVWNGGPGFVGTCGTGFSKAQVERLSKYATRAIWFDPGYQAQKRANELADQLSVFPGETFSIVTETDPGEASAEDIKHIREEVGL